MKAADAGRLEQANRWRARAEELRKLAQGIDDVQAKNGILAAALSYDRLAARVIDQAYQPQGVTNPSLRRRPAT